LHKGESICAYPGCAHDAVEVFYTGGVKRGFCDDHIKQSSPPVPITAFWLPHLLIVLALFFCIYLVAAFVGACSASPDSISLRRRDPFRLFVVLCVTGIVGMNCLFWALSRYAC
jgi:hypothetical protein